MGLYKGKSGTGKVFKGTSLKGAFKVPKMPKAKTHSVSLGKTKTAVAKAPKIKI